ncbi:hypothetical protein J4230_05645 [Candidatus Woesearchaeota archaeon]|nr:hypothetical protein [Candidatus Woesearchaeota archaeon]
MKNSNKKADFEIETVLKILLALIILLVIIGLIFLLKGKSINILEQIKEILRLT